MEVIAFKNPNIRMLTLHHTDLSDSSTMRRISNILTSNPKIRTLMIADCELSTPEAAELFRRPFSKNVKIFGLVRSSPQFRLPVEFLNIARTSLRSLILDPNSITPDMEARFLEALQTNSKLTMVHSTNMVEHFSSVTDRNRHNLSTRECILSQLFFLE